MAAKCRFRSKETGVFSAPDTHLPCANLFSLIRVVIEAGIFISPGRYRLPVNRLLHSPF